MLVPPPPAAVVVAVVVFVSKIGIPEDEDEEVRLLKDQFKMSEHLNLKLRVRKKSLYFEDVLLGFRSQDLREVKLCPILVKAI